MRYLEEITIIGYKSIRELKAFRLSSGLNVLIGANGSGKTNFIRFFELLGQMMTSPPDRGLQNYISARGRADAFLFQGMKTTQELQAHLKFGRNEYRFILRAADDRSLFFAQESAPFEGPEYGRTENDQGTGHFESKLFQKYLYTNSQSELWAVDTLKSWRVYHFHDTSPSAPVMGLWNIVDYESLHANAANLAPFLMNLEKNYPICFAQIVEVIRSVAPFFGQFVLKEISLGQTQLLWKDRYSDMLYYPHQLSDGTLRFICLAAVLLQPNLPNMLILDESELGLHPFAIKQLVSMLQQAAAQTQLIISTQSSLLLDELTPEQIIVANHHQGETLLKRLNSEELQAWLEEYTLGQLWEKNVLGGLP